MHELPCSRFVVSPFRKHRIIWVLVVEVFNNHMGLSDESMLRLQTRHLSHWAHRKPVWILAWERLHDLKIEPLGREGHADHIEVIANSKAVKF